MRYVLVLSVALLAGCSQQSREDLAADPARLKALRAQCAAERQAVGEGACRAAADAYRHRFFDGHGGPEEYVALEDLPPIPATFDSPVDDAPAAFASEATP